MSDSNLPAPANEANDDERRPEVRLELTRTGVQEVLSLYSQEQNSGPGEPTFSLGFADIEAAVRERRRMLVYGLVAGLVTGLFVALASTPLYPVKAQVVVEREQSTRAESSSRTSGGSAFVATQAQVMESESVLAEAVAGIPRAAHLDEDDDAVADATAAVTASPVSGTQVVALGYLGPDADYGVALIDAIVDAYRKVLRRSEAALQREKLRAKQAELAVLDAEAIELEEKLAALRLENGTFGSAEGSASAQTILLRDLVRQLTEVRNERIALENRLATGGDQLAILDPAVRSLQEQLWDAEAELARVRLTLTPRHPAVEAAQSEVTVLKRQLEQGSKATPEALHRDIEAARGLENQLTDVYQAERKRMALVERDRREESLVLEELERVRTLSDERRGELLDQRLVTRLAETGELGVHARMIERPTLPEEAVWPRPGFLLTVGALGGLLVGLVVAVISLQRERALERAAREQWVPPTAREAAEINLR